jgi:hypothetical protein
MTEPLCLPLDHLLMSMHSVGCLCEPCPLQLTWCRRAIDIGKRIRIIKKALLRVTNHYHFGEGAALVERCPFSHLEQDECLFVTPSSSEHPFSRQPDLMSHVGAHHVNHNRQPLEMRRVACRFVGRLKAIGLRALGKVNRSHTTSSTEKAPTELRLGAIAGSLIRARAVERRYAPLRLLGAGENGQVHLCRDTKMGMLVAVKTVHHEVPTSAPLEAGILHFLGQHANIVRYHTVLKDQCQDFYMQPVFEYCELGDLADYVNSTIGDVTSEMFIWSALK